MPDQEDITNQYQLLEAHRRRLAMRLRQLAMIGLAQVSPEILFDIESARESIRQIKHTLRSWGEVVDDHPDDEDTAYGVPATSNVQVPQMSEAVRGSRTRDQIFISYSHADKRWLDRLMVHLRPLVRSDNFKVWNDTMIDPGANWRAEIDKALKAAKVALLLVSADFLASDFIARNELPPLLKAAQEEGAVIMPVIIGHCRFTHYPDLSGFQALNSPSQPLADMPRARREGLFVKLTEAVEKALRENV